MKISIVIFFLALSFSLPAMAHQATAVWEAPTTRENGQPMDVSEIGGYLLQYDCGDPKEILISDGTATEHTINDLPDAICSFQLAAFDQDGVIGEYSAPVIQEFGVKPSGPINFGVSAVSQVPQMKLDCEVRVNCSVE